MTTTISNQAPLFTEPTTLNDLGVDAGVLHDLTLKTLVYRGRMTRADLSDALKLSGNVVHELMAALGQEGFTSVLGSEGNVSRTAYMYTLTQKGLDRADAAFQRSGYVGPAPVPLQDYVDQIQAQSVAGAEVAREDILRALGPLILSDQTVQRIGRAASSRKSTLIYGASGNGKTTAVKAIGAVLGGTIHVPYAIEMAGQIVHVHDPSKHLTVQDERDPGVLTSRPDRRWVQIKRPVIWAGGELTRHSLELVYDENTKVYEAPLQLKANGGTLIIDDFGRQQMPAVQLLNRWIVALEGGVDHLTMHTGQMIEIPFDVLILFSTNLPPDRLADEAFLRRIRYKVEIPDPTVDEYHAIFQRECAAQGLAYDESVVQHLLRSWYQSEHRSLRGCHPRDLIEAVIDAARFERQTPALTPAMIDEACTTYFLHPMNAPA